MVYRTTYDPNPVCLTYSEDELRQLIGNYVQEQKGEFSYKSICVYILQRAKEEGKVPNANHTEYSSNELNPVSGRMVSKILWELIWKKQIFIVFGKNPYGGGYYDDVRLCKC